MRQGDKIHILKEIGKNPISCESTKKVAIALACGFGLVDQPYIDTVEEKPDGSVQRETSWILDGNREVEFVNEKIDISTFFKRLDDVSWCEQNPNHPIAYFKAFLIKFDSIVNSIKDKKPAVLIRKGRAFAIIPHGTPEAEVEKILNRL